MEDKQTDDSNSLDTLEEQTTVVADDSSTNIDTTPAATPPPDTPEPPKPVQRNRIRFFIQRILRRFNIYLLLFILIVMLTIVFSFISYGQNKKAAEQQEQLVTEPLSQETLDKLRQSDVKIGDPKQILSVESNAIFAGKVLIRDSLEVAGSIKVGGPLNLPGITVSGTSSLDQVQINNLQIAGSTTIQGPLSVQNNLTVSGSGTFGGTLSASRLNIETLQINGDLLINRHIDAGGGTPGKSDGSALGSGGTSSVSGTDTAGTVAINTGSSPGAGCFVTVNFNQRFNGTPHVVITPVGSAAAGLNYYINRSSTSFSICSTNAASGGQNFAFDYIVID